MAKDPYTILGVSPQASHQQIAAAYRRLARKHHPDVSPGLDASAVMQDINWAYATLGNPAKRLRYDRARSDGGGRRGADTWRRSARRRRAPSRYSGTYVSHSRGYVILGETVDRAIVGAVVGLLTLAATMLLGLEVLRIGAPLSLAIGTWIAAVPNPRLSSQHGAAIGAIIGLFSAANFSVSLFDSGGEADLVTGLICCAPFTVLLGGSLGAMLGTLAGWIRGISALRG